MVIKKLILFLIIFFCLFCLITFAHSELNDNALNNYTNNVEINPVFKVFDGTNFKDKPKLNKLKLYPIDIIYEANLFSNNFLPDSKPLLLNNVKIANSSKFQNRIIVLDIERWMYLPNLNELYINQINLLKKINPNFKSGYYSIIPKRDYWRAIQGQNSTLYKEWQLENDLRQPIADAVDYLFPSLYTFYDDPFDWVIYAEANIKEARRLAKGKPVYAFLWFAYHESNDELKGKTISADFWRLQLETVRSLADGVVIWGGGKWDPEAPWWIETLKFLSDLNGADNIN